MSRATIYSVAAASGVSPSTVSRAFTRPEMVRAEVRARILEVANEMDYQPHLAARRLVTGRNNMVGVLMPDITNPFFPPLLRAIQSASAGHGSNVLLVDSGETASNEARLISQIRTQVDGLVIASPRSPAASLRNASRDLPCVVVNRVFRDVPAVVCDDTRALADAVRHLKELGHRRIGLLSGPPASWIAQQRNRAVRAAATQLGLDLAVLGAFPASFTGGREAALELMRSRTTAALAFDDVMAAGVIAGLTEAGWAVPGDMSVIGCDDVLLASMVTPALTTITAPVTELGQRAVDLLWQLLDDPGHDNKVVRCASSLTVRSSTAPPPAA